jgi:hypothetical protein
MTNNIDKQSFGQAGACFVNGANGSPQTGDFCALQLLAATKFKSLTMPKASGEALFNATEGSAPEFPAGTVLYGQCTSFELHSGMVLAYNTVKV